MQLPSIFPAVSVESQGSGGSAEPVGEFHPRSLIEQDGGLDSAQVAFLLHSPPVPHLQNQIFIIVATANEAICRLEGRGVGLG